MGWVGGWGGSGSEKDVVRELPKLATINRWQVGRLWQGSSRRSSFGSVAGGVLNKGNECAKWEGVREEGQWGSGGGSAGSLHRKRHARCLGTLLVYPSAGEATVQ